MVTQWKVFYTLSAPLVTKSQRVGYPTLGVAFNYKQSGKLTGVEHILDVSGDDNDPWPALEESRRQLAVMWEAFNFRVGIQIPLEGHAEKIGPTPDWGTGLVFGASARMAAW